MMLLSRFLLENVVPDAYLSPDAERARTQYANIMEEIKRRNQAISEMLVGTFPPQPTIIVSEFCYLQLRFICELVVPACAIAHRDLEGISGKKLQKEWRAGELATKLEQLHPAFYPVPGRQIVGADGKVERIDPISDGFLTISDLISRAFTVNVAIACTSATSSRSLIKGVHLSTSNSFTCGRAESFAF